MEKKFTILCAGCCICSCTWVGLTWILIVHCLSDSTWADGTLAEEAGKLGTMMEHPNQSQRNPGARAHRTPSRQRGIQKL